MFEFDSWSRQVRDNREQIERLRESEAEADFYAPHARWFAPGMSPAPEVATVLDLVVPGETWLDIGAGGGRFAVPLAQKAGAVVAIEPSPAMRGLLASVLSEAALTNVTVLDLRWPPADAIPPADVALAAHVIYDQEGALEFIEAMERYARRLCVVALRDRAPSTPDEGIWRELYGEPLAALPASADFAALLAASGREATVVEIPNAPVPPLTVDDAHALSRRLYWLAEGSQRDAAYRRVLEGLASKDGTVRLPSRPERTSMFSWMPVE